MPVWNFHKALSAIRPNPDGTLLSPILSCQPMEAKKQLRTLIAQKKRQQPEMLLKKWSACLLKQLETHPRFTEARTILLYYSLPDEVQTHDFVERWSREKQIVLPTVKGDELELHYYTGRNDLRKGSYGIEEPTGELLSNLQEIDLAIIPGVSFDGKGNRLGRGKGYYDRLLPRLSSYNIGICFHFQVCPEIPSEPFDCSMHEVWTEKGRLYISGK